jgi:hypothetical protein
MGDFQVTERLSSSMSGRSDRVAKRIGCAAIVAAAGVGLGLSVHHDVQFTSSVTTTKYVTQSDGQLRQEECVYDAIRLLVPKGATVYVTARQFQPTQRLAELSTLWAVPEANIADAQYQLSLIGPHGQFVYPYPLTDAAPDPAKGQCEGMALEVRRL